MSKTKQAVKPAVFSKAQFLESQQFTTMQKHILSVVLKEDEMYTCEQAKQLVEDLLNKEVC